MIVKIFFYVTWLILKGTKNIVGTSILFIEQYETQHTIYNIYYNIVTIHTARQQN